MSCESKFPDTDPASLDTSLVTRMPEVKGLEAGFLRDAAMEFFRRSLVWRDQTQSLVVNADQSMYTLNAPVSGTIVKVIDIYCGQDESEIRIARDSEVSQRHDEQRWHDPTSQTIQFHKLFSETETLRVAVALTTNGAAGNADMIQQYREAILSGAQYLATMAKAQETQDRQVAMAHKADFELHIMEAGKRYRRQLRGERKPMSRTRAMAEGVRY